MNSIIFTQSLGHLQLIVAFYQILFVRTLPLHKGLVYVTGILLINFVKSVLNYA